MAFDEALAARVEQRIGMRADVSSKKMFGGIAWMLNGNMCVGIVKSDLMARVGKQEEATLLARPGARPMDFTGKPMAGYLFIEKGVLEDDEALDEWIGHAEAFVKTLPKK